MISVVIPTRNRAAVLERVLPSYYGQAGVGEVIVVDDCSADDTRRVVERIGERFGGSRTVYLRQAEKSGAVTCKSLGAAKASGEYVLFGEDDAFLDADYCKVLLGKLASERDVGIASGRIVYLLPGESEASALARFGSGTSEAEPFNKWAFMLRHSSRFEGDRLVPFTHALYMTRKAMLDRWKIDEHYRRGNGFREESDFQMGLFIEGYKVLVTNDTRCFHFSREEVRAGGQRMSILRQLLWNCYYTNYFYRKHFAKARARLGLGYPRQVGMVLFFLHQAYHMFVRPLRRVPELLLARVRS